MSVNSRHGPIEGSPETSSFYRLAFECANEGIWLVDGEWKTTLVNPRMCQMLGYSEEEMHGRNPSDFFMDSEKARHWDEAVARRQQGVKEDYDFLFRCKDGSELRVMVSAAPLIDASGTFAGSVAVMTDLTQRHAFEQRSRAEDRLDVTATMLDGIAHHFNNKMQPLLNYADLSLRDPQISSQTRGYLEGIRCIGESCQEMISQLRSTLYGTHGERELVEIAGVVESAIQSLQKQKPGNVEVHFAKPIQPISVLVDRRKMELAFSHIYENAIHAIEAGKRGTVRFSVRRVDLEAQEAEQSQLTEGSYARVDIEDNGRGMDEAILRRVFDPFFSTKPPDQAWGNGLAFAEAVITSHKGAVRARSSLGHGSAIAVYLPLSSSRTAASGSVLGPNRILLVEDSREAINIWQEYLEMEGFEVTSFSDSTRAAEFVAKHIKDFDILITDLSMPGTSGMDLIAQVRALDPRKAVILTTGYYRLEIQAKLKSLGQALMLKKPVKLDTLRSAIHSLMQKSTEG